VNELKPLIDMMIVQNERMLNEQIEQGKTLIRLTATVEEHKKRSDNLEDIQVTCRSSCNAHIETVQILAEATQKTLDDIFFAFKIISVIFGVVIVGAIAITANIAQIMSYFRP
jgi:hypothetical protein